MQNQCSFNGASGERITNKKIIAADPNRKISSVRLTGIELDHKSVDGMVEHIMMVAV